MERDLRECTEGQVGMNPPGQHRRKAPIATLAALCALATALTLAPATATAMDDNGGAGECRSVPWAPPGAGWNGTEFCILTDGSAGGGGGGGATGGDGSGSGGGTVGEVIVIVDPVKPTNPLCPSARLCLPGQSGGGRPLGIEGDGPSAGGPKRGGTPAKGEVKRPKPLTRGQCKEIEANGTLPSVGQKLAELDGQLAELEGQAKVMSLTQTLLEEMIAVLTDREEQTRWWKYQRATPAQLVNDVSAVRAAREGTIKAMRDLATLGAQRQVNLDKTKDLKRERGRVVSAGKRETETALQICRAKYGP
jgi:hypothetical protein